MVPIFRVVAMSMEDGQRGNSFSNLVRSSQSCFIFYSHHFFSTITNGTNVYFNIIGIVIISFRNYQYYLFLLLYSRLFAMLNVNCRFNATTIFSYCQWEWIYKATISILNMTCSLADYDKDLSIFPSPPPFSQSSKAILNELDGNLNKPSLEM